MIRRCFLVFASLCLALPSALTAEGPAPLRVLFLGNSITKHGPKADIGWERNWGMAASAAEKDYVHLVTKGLTPPGGPAPVTLVQNIAEFERRYASDDVAARLKAAVEFAPTLVILAIGENVPALKTDEERGAFTRQVTTLLSLLKKGPASPAPVRMVVRSPFWHDAMKDQCLRQACEAVGGSYVDISTLDKTEANYARSERPYQNAGVARHPGDRGMQAIAEAILKAVPRS